jgi:AraC family transcriptional regulator
MKNVLSVAIALVAIAMMAGCGGTEQPAKTETPAEPVFVAQTMNLPAMKVASIAKMGPYAEVGQCVGDLTGIVETEKLAVKGALYGVYFDNPENVKPGSTRYEVRVPVAPETKYKVDKKTGFAVKDVPEMTVAVTEYMGPYDQVGPTYEKLFKWVAANKLEAATPPAMIEWYLSDPAKVKPESLMARVAVVIKPPAPPEDATKPAEEPKKEEPKTETEAPTGK